MGSPVLPFRVRREMGRARAAVAALCPRVGIAFRVRCWLDNLAGGCRVERRGSQRQREAGAGARTRVAVWGCGLA